MRFIATGPPPGMRLHDKTERRRAHLQPCTPERSHNSDMPSLERVYSNSGTSWSQRTHGYFWGNSSFHSATQEPAEGHDAGMRKCLNVWDLLLLGVAAVVGAGIFVVTGVTAKTVAGPGVIVSYMVAGVACIICALCYAEYATETTITGGSVVYSARTFGKFVAWLVAINVLMEYVIAAAAVGKGISPYFCTLIGQAPDAAIIHATGVGGQPLPIDLVAGGVVLGVTLLLVAGVREASWVNTATTSVVVLVIIFTIIAGLVKVNPANFHPFIPPAQDGKFGVAGMFSAASSVFFAYVGFDMVATAAEESVNPLRDVPVATVGSVVICGAMYVLMAVAIVGMVPYTQINAAAPFSQAFRQLGMPWAVPIVSLGAFFAIFDTIIVVIYGMSRTFVVLGRLHLVPEWMARVNPRTHTPIPSTLFCGLISAVLSTFVPIDILVDLVSLGTLMAFAVVSLGVAWRRYYQPGCGRPKAPLVVALFCVLGGAVILGCSFKMDTHYAVWIVGGALWLAGTVFFAASKQVYTPRGYKTPLFPFWPCVGVLVTLFLIGTLGPASWERWAYILAAGLVFYAAFDLFDRKWGGHKGVGEFSKAQLEREDLGVASMAALEEGAAGKAGGGEEAGAPLDTSTSKDTGNVEVGVAVSGGK